MRGAVVSVAALGLVLGVAAAVRGAPPEDLDAYCRAINPETSALVRCLGAEKGSQDRLVRAQGAIEPSVWAHCHGASASWANMEACVVAQPNSPTPNPSGAPPPAAAVPGAPGAALPGVVPPAAPGVPSTPPTTPLPGVVPPATPTVPSQPPAAASPPEPERPSRPISEAEAERQLQDVLRRTGPAAHCTKKQYGNGWAIVCD